MRTDRYAQEVKFLDKNRDSRLDATELGRTALAAMDTDKSGEVSVQEFSAYAALQEDTFVKGGGKLYDGLVISGVPGQATFDGLMRRGNAATWAEEAQIAKEALDKRSFGAKLLDVLAFIGNLFAIPFKLICAGVLAVRGEKVLASEIYFPLRLRELSQARELAASQPHAVELLKTAWEDIAAATP